MRTLQVFFDYACPYCLRGHGMLLELLPQYPDMEVEWFPCEAHPRPDRYGLHSDLCARGMYIAQDYGVDMLEYHDKMYRAALTDRVNIEDARAVAGVLGGLLDGAAFCAALAEGAYRDRLRENNRLAWEAYRFPAVPSYRMNGALLKSIEDVGVNKRQLVDFLERR